MNAVGVRADSPTSILQQQEGYAPVMLWGTTFASPRYAAFFKLCRISRCHGAARQAPHMSRLCSLSSGVSRLRYSLHYTIHIFSTSYCYRGLSESKAKVSESQARWLLLQVAASFTVVFDCRARAPNRPTHALVRTDKLILGLD